MKIEDVLRELKNNLSRDYISSGIIGLDGIHLAFDSVDPQQNFAQTAAELVDGVKDIIEMLTEIKSGRLYHLNITTDKLRIFIIPIGKQGKYLCLLIIKTDGNVGKAILELEKAEKLLREELEQNGLAQLPYAPIKEDRL
jgi:predicted regulator of Ras-like GTPase activity (Roadblock/LC7/MglB family)